MLFSTSINAIKNNHTICDRKFFFYINLPQLTISVEKKKFLIIWHAVKTDRNLNVILFNHYDTIKNVFFG